MIKKTAMMIGISLCLGLTSCANMSKQDIGTLTGGAVGGLLGSQFGNGSGQILAAVGGTLLGAFIGNQIGANMDRTDQLMMDRSMNSGQSMNWTNDRTGARYQVEPGPVVDYHHEKCRNYTMFAYIEGKKRPIHGRACRRDGQWVSVNGGDAY